MKLKLNNSINLTQKATWIQKIWKQREIILMALPGVLLIFIFNYLPMAGLIIAFKNYKPGMTFLNAPWVGLKWFTMMFSNPLVWNLLKNTFLLGIYTMLWSFPLPIILALVINEIRMEKFKKLVQTISYIPYFISTVIVVGILQQMVSSEGIINMVVKMFGHEPILFWSKPQYFRSLYIISGLWTGIGWGSIIYLAAITGIDPQLYEAATMDGCNRLKKIWHITIPCIVPTVVILFILNIGSVFGNDFQKILLMYSPQTYETADVIGTYVYREGIQGARYSYSTAVGLTMSVLSFAVVYVSNYISRKVSEISLW